MEIEKTKKLVGKETTTWKRILPPGAEVRLGRKDYEKPITKDLKKRRCLRREFGSVVEDGSGSWADLGKGRVDLPVQLVEIFTTNTTGHQSCGG